MTAIPNYWTTEELAADADSARARFVESRLHPDPEDRVVYEAEIERGRNAAETLLRRSDDLTRWDAGAIRDREALDIARYATLPMTSADDLDTLFATCVGAWIKQTASSTRRVSREPTPEAFALIAEYLANNMDPILTPWLRASREPAETEREMFALWVASARAASRVGSARKNRGAQRQENAVRESLVEIDYGAVEKGRQRGAADSRFRPIELPPRTFTAKPRVLNGKSADVVIRLADDHPSGIKVLVVECKDSNSAINSRKRLFEVAAKRAAWLRGEDLPNEFRTVAVLSGVFGLRELEDAQKEGIHIIWEHRLSDLQAFAA